MLLYFYMSTPESRNYARTLLAAELIAISDKSSDNIPFAEIARSAGDNEAAKILFLEAKKDAQRQAIEVGVIARIGARIKANKDELVTSKEADNQLPLF
jgi:hypothetical protein